MENGSPDLLLWGPGGSGKTHLATVKGIGIGCKYPKNRIFYIRRKKVDLRLTLWKKFTELLPQGLVVRKDENQMIYVIRNGTEFMGLGLDSIEDINKLASTEAGMAIVEEATEIAEEYYDEKIKRAVRLPRVPFHQTLSLCNPAAPAHWIHKKWLKENNKGCNEIYMPTIPKKAGILPDSWYDWLDGLTGVFAQRYKKGKWVVIEGIVYPFDPKLIIDPFPIPPDGERIMAIDFGFNHPFVCQWWYISPSDIWYLYRQIYMTYRTVKTHSIEINRFCEKDGITPIAICDHDAEDRATLEENGIETVPAYKDRLAGQQKVYDKFEHNKIFFFRDSLVELDQRQLIKKLPTCIEDEFPYYVWTSKGKEDMVKQKDDAVDSLRYAIASYDRLNLNTELPPKVGFGHKRNFATATMGM